MTRLLVASHSNVHIRQQAWWRYVASLGHDVLVVTPGRWGDQVAQASRVEGLPGSYELRPLSHIGGADQYGFTFLGLGDLMGDFQPDWCYVQQEPESALADQVVRQLRGRAPSSCRFALFSWENRKWSERRETGFFQCPPGVRNLIQSCDLVVCGNGEAEEIMRDVGAPRTLVGLQVGVDTAHFTARPGVPRTVNVAYIGRETPEKGLPLLAQVWPTTERVPWTPWLRLPWEMSRCRVVVTFSLDRPQWREQAPNYVTCEAISAGAAVVTSNGGSIPF